VTLGRVNSDVIGSSVQGEPVVYISGFVVLVLLAFARPWVESLVTVAHEGGHMVVAILTGNPVANWHLVETENNNSGSGGATSLPPGWSPGLSSILIAVAGYLTPPLVGLAGVALVLNGKAWSVLLASAVLLLAAFLKAKDLFSIVVVLAFAAGIGWVVFAGSPGLQAAVAVGLVWLMLVGGVTSLQGQGWGSDKSTDAGQLARATWIPAFLWVSLFGFVAIAALWVGARRLLGI
jgi:Peptidase M50B-like